MRVRHHHPTCISPDDECHIERGERCPKLHKTKRKPGSQISVSASTHARLFNEAQKRSFTIAQLVNELVGASLDAAGHG